MCAFPTFRERRRDDCGIIPLDVLQYPRRAKKYTHLCSEHFIKGTFTLWFLIVGFLGMVCVIESD